MIEQYEKYRSKLDFIKAYSAVGNAASGSKFDPNANVDSKNIATLDAELPKEESIGINRLLMSDMLTELFGREWAESYLQDLEDHLIYVHDETHVMMPYCVSLTLYPFLMNGLKSIGGISGAPKHLDSFCGEFINLIFAVAAQFAGAVSTPEWLSYMDYFIRKEYGEDYRLHADEVVDGSNQKKTIRDVIASKFQQIVHSLNQPAGARGFQSTFWNIAYFDAYYFEGLFEGFVFPDGTPMNWESVQWLQEYFMKWFNAERLITPLTFPVETVNSLTDGQNPKDERMADFVAEMWAEGHSFFWYNSDSVDSLASCCFDGDQEVILTSVSNDNPTSCKLWYAYQLFGSKRTLYTIQRGALAPCHVIRLPARQMFVVTTNRGYVFKVTDNHIFPTDKGDKMVKDLQIGDCLTCDTDWGDTEYSFCSVTAVVPYESSDSYVYCLQMEDESNPYFTLPCGVITHNCRLRNGITENSFSYTLGAGGIATGSKKVITMNINRIVQQATRDGVPISQRVAEITERVHKYLLAYNELLKRAYEAKLLPVYEAGFISLSKQYLTCGLSGFVCGAEFLGIEISDNEAYREYGEQILKPIYELNQAHKTKEVMFNTEFVPRMRGYRAA